MSCMHVLTLFSVAIYSRFHQLSIDDMRLMSRASSSCVLFTFLVFYVMQNVRSPASPICMYIYMYTPINYKARVVGRSLL